MHKINLEVIPIILSLTLTHVEASLPFVHVPLAFLNEDKTATMRAAIVLY